MSREGLTILVALCNIPWIGRAIALAFIIMIQQSLTRIENRMNALEKRVPPHE